MLERRTKVLLDDLKNMKTGLNRVLQLRFNHLYHRESLGELRREKQFAEKVW